MGHKKVLGTSHDGHYPWFILVQNVFFSLGCSNLVKSPPKVTVSAYSKGLTVMIKSLHHFTSARRTFFADTIFPILRSNLDGSTALSGLAVAPPFPPSVKRELHSGVA